MTRTTNNAAFAARMRERRGEKRPARVRRALGELPHLVATKNGGTPGDPSVMFFDVYGAPMTREDWAEAFEGERTIAYDLVSEARGIEVSTVWMGMREVVFETMVTGDDGVTFHRGARFFDEALEEHERQLASLKR